MPRPHHINAERAVYFVTAVTKDRFPIFEDHKNAQITMNAINFGRKENWYFLFAYVIMPDHFHLLMTPRKRKISEIMKGIKGYTARIINERRQWKGSLWEEGYYDYLIGDISERMDSSAHQKARYIEENPVRKGFVDKREDWLYSSARLRENLDW